MVASYPHFCCHGARSLWAVVLAGGDGRRLSEVARARYGYARPKQYCDFGCGCTLLARTIRRARRLVPDERIVVVTRSDHHVWAHECLAPFPRVHLIEQPANRGTTPGLLLSLFAVMEEDPSARALVLPSDHVVADEARFADVLRSAAHSLLEDPDPVLLLGAPPSDAEGDYGWILPLGVPDERWPRVIAFREKPPPAEARRLVARGALRNTFVMAAEPRSLVTLAMQHVPGWYRGLVLSARNPETIAEAYETLPSSDFSRDVLERARCELRVVPTGEVGWDDIGTPDRLARAMERESAATG
ncbi:MAG: sugar phosphate nucleotidyltransferase [Myxococcota bacterium]